MSVGRPPIAGTRPGESPGGSAGRGGYDAVVIGAGLNGLTAAVRLARGGLRVVVLERREAIGGLASTAEFAPGFRADQGRDDWTWNPGELVGELGLDRHGLRLVDSRARVVARGSGGETLHFGAGGPDLGELARLSPGVAAKWPAFAARVATLAGFLAELYRGPVPSVDLAAPGDLAAALRLAFRFRGLGAREMTEFLRVMPMSVAEWLDDWFDLPLLKGVLAARGITQLSLGPRAAGTAFVFLHHHVGRPVGGIGPAAYPIGGTGAVADALASAAGAAGVEVRTGVRVAQVALTNGRASGVVLDGGDEIAARVVVSGASPRHTFLELCEPWRLPPEFVGAVQRIRYRGAWARVNLALEGAPVLDDPTVCGAYVAPSIDHLERAADDAKYGRTSAKPFVSARVPTLIDPGLTPDRRHVVSAHVQYAPYRRRSGSWDAAARDALASAVVAAVEEQLTGIARLVNHRQVLAPPDLEAEFGIPEGQADHGELALDQALFMRPVPACSHYRSPVAGLYVCGAGSHPGGAIAGRAGSNAARVVLADIRKGR